MSALRLRPDLEDALCALPEVQAVSIVTTAEGTPLEVHVLAEPGKPAKQVVRDVQSLSLAAFGVEIDRRIVSVVQIGAARPGSPDDALSGDGSVSLGDEPFEDPLETGAPPLRPVVQRVSVGTDSYGSTASVTVRIGSDEFTGDATGAAAPTGRPRVIAEAAVRALSELLGTGCAVESAQLVPAGSREVAVVVLAVQVPRFGELLLTGSALVRSYPDDAVVRAVLDGLNRHLTA